MQPLIRHAAIDVLRIAATLAVFLIHAAAPYAAGDWHLSYYPKSASLTITNAWLLLWAMPLLFMLSGMSLSLALRKYTPAVLICERLKRLLVPLLFGIFVVVPPQVYIERITRAQFAGSFLEFLPHYLNAPYLSIGGAGNFAWMGLHLWYLLMLLLLTLVLMPVLRWISAAAGVLVRIEAAAKQPGILLLGALAPAGIELALGNVGLGGWNMLTYPVFLVFGFVLAQVENGVAALRRDALLAGMLATAASIVLFVLTYSDGLVPYGQLPTQFQVLLHACAGWWWLVALFGGVSALVPDHSPVLSYLSDLAMPFYVLHQTVIIVLGFYINASTLPVTAKYGLLVVGACGVCVLLYAVIIRRSAALRILFGLRPRSARAAI
jgi:membrane-bound acyltransferase YfiQ involved in biofilm formation